MDFSFSDCYRLFNRLSKESQENQEASGANQRSVLPSVSIDEPTESEDNQSDNKSEGELQLIERIDESIKYVNQKLNVSL